MHDSAKIIYLDSKDYSNLSAPSRTDDTEQLRSTLIELSKSPSLTFVFSGSHISEMAPIKSAHAQHASMRTETLVTICKRNALISFDRLIKFEIDNLIKKQKTPIQVLDRSGQWFPEISEIIDPLEKLNISAQVKDAAKTEKLNRKERRFYEKTMLKNGNMRKNLESKFGQFNVDELISQYPMHPKNAITIKNYIFGNASRSQAEQAFLESLRDPSWMMKWFSEHHDRLSAIGDWVRKPAEEMINAIKNTLVPLAEQGHNGSEDEKKAINSLLTNEKWGTNQNDFVKTVVHRISTVLFKNPTEKHDDIIEIETYCPGIVTCLRVLHNSIKNSLISRPRKIKESDVVDAIHAIYIPYVSYFSADRYMANIMKPLAEKYGTHIISDITKIPELLK